MPACFVCVPVHPLQTISGTAYCKFSYRLVVTGPLSVPPSTLSELGTSMMANAFGLNAFYDDVTCAANNFDAKLPFCTYWAKAKMCYAYPFSQLDPYNCSFE